MPARVRTIEGREKSLNNVIISSSGGGRFAV